MVDDTSDTWVIVPMFNEARTITGVVTELKTYFPNVVCVDDGSSDGSVALAHVAGAVIVRHAVNLGQGAALQTGFDYALCKRARWVVTFDADGQHLVSDAAELVQQARKQQVDVVLASRFLGRTESMPSSRRLVLRAAIIFSRWSTGLALTDTHNGLRVLSRHALEAVRLHQPRMAYASELESAIRRHGLSYAEVATTVRYTEYSRAKGQRNSNAINILFDLAIAKLKALS